MSEIPESKNPFDFYQSPWWKDMNNKLCVDGWPQVVVSLNCMVRDAKNEYEQLQKQNHELIKALEFYADGLNYESVYEDDEMDLHIKIDREDVCFDEDDQYFGYAGDFARKTLAKFSKEEL